MTLVHSGHLKPLLLAPLYFTVCFAQPSLPKHLHAPRGFLCEVTWRRYQGPRTVSDNYLLQVKRYHSPLPMALTASALSAFSKVRALIVPFFSPRLTTDTTSSRGVTVLASLGGAFVVVVMWWSGSCFCGSCFYGNRLQGVWNWGDLIVV
jgi:hypothetical protein